MQKLECGTGLTEGILDTDAAHLNGELLAEHLCDCAPESADHRMLLSSKYPSRLPGRLDYDLSVDGLDGVDVYKLSTDAVCSEYITGRYGLYHLETRGDDGAVASVAKNLSLAYLEMIIRAVIDDRNGQTAETQINRSLHHICGADSGSRLHIVRGIDYGHARDCSHKSDILVALVCGTVLADRDACVCGTDLYIEVRVADGVSYLLVGTSGRKHRK